LASFQSFQSAGTEPSDSNWLKSIVTGTAITVLIAFKNLEYMPSVPTDLSYLRFAKRFKTSHSVMRMSDNLSLFVRVVNVSLKEEVPTRDAHLTD